MNHPMTRAAWLRETVRTALIVPIIALSVASANAQSIFTVAGGGSNDGRPGTLASVDAYGVAVNASGDLYIADRRNNVIRKVDAGTGIISTVAGNGTAGFAEDGELAIETPLEEPTSVAVDSGGNIYLAENRTRRIRRVDAMTGVISTFAGGGNCCSSGDGGPATEAYIDGPWGIAFDGSDNLFISDAFDDVIRRVDAQTGIISTVAGNGERGDSGDNGPATGASLYFPTDVAADSSGNLFIADWGNHRVRMVDAVTGVIVTVAGVGSSGAFRDGVPATESHVNANGIALDDSGNLYIAAYERVRRVDGETGIITTVAGNGEAGFSGDGGPATLASIGGAEDVVLDSFGNLYIADWSEGRVRRVDTGTGIISTVAGNGSFGFSGDGGPATQASFLFVGAVTVDSKGQLYIADFVTDQVLEVDEAGIIRVVAGNGQDGFSGDGGLATEAGLDGPASVAIDDQGNLFIAGFFTDRVRRVDAETGVITTVAGNGESGFSGDGGPATEASLDEPVGVALDQDGNLYISDRDNLRIRRVDAVTGVITTVAGNGERGFSGDGGPATEASLSNPRGIALDAAADLYIADTSNDRIRKVNGANGMISTVAGMGSGFNPTPDGIPATESRVLDPQGIAVDSFGNLYIASESRIRRVDRTTGLLTTLAGCPHQVDCPVEEFLFFGGFYGDGGPATQAALTAIDVASDADGNVYIADSNARRVRAVLRCGPGNAPILDSPGNGAVNQALAPTLEWSEAAGAFSYDVLLGTSPTPSNIVARDLTSTSFTLSNLEPGTRYYWSIVANGDPFCVPQWGTHSQVRSFTTETTCAAPGTFSQIGPMHQASTPATSTQLSWTPAAGAGRYDVYFGTTSPPPFLASTSQTSATVSRLVPGNTYYWSVLARASCDDNQTRRSAERSFSVVGACEPAGDIGLSAPSNGEIGVPTTVSLSWTASANASSYDLFLDTNEQPALFAANLSETAIRISGLSQGTRHFWRVRANVDCDPSKSATTPIASFTTEIDCPVPQATSIVFTPPGGVGAGQTYAITWREAKGLDPGGGYLVERSLDPAFSTILDVQRTRASSATFTANAPGVHYHRVRPVMGCDPTVIGPASASASVNVIADQPTVIFTVEPEAVFAEPGESLEVLRTTFTLENLSTSPAQVILSAARIESIPFFTIRDPFGGDSTFVTLEPREPKSFEVRFSGPPIDLVASYQGLIVVSAPGSPIVPYAFVNLKIGAEAGAAPQFRFNGTSSEYAFFPGFAGDDTNRPPITVDIHNPGSTPMELGAEIGPEVWLEPEPGWNDTPIPAGASRPVRLVTRRTRAINGSALPRYTYFTVRTSTGEAARLLVQDNGAPSVGTRRTAALDPDVRTLIVPEVVSETTAMETLVSKVRLTNVGTEPVQAELIFTPAGVDGFSASVERATVVVPPIDVVTLTDPLVQVFGLARPEHGALEILASGQRIGLLRVDASVVSGDRADASLMRMPTVSRGDGARSGSPHRIAGIPSSGSQTTSLVLTETSGTDGADLTVKLFDGAGEEKGEQTFRIERYGTLRIDDAVSALGGGGMPTGWIDITSSSGGGSVIGVATIADASSGRAATLVSQPVGSEAAGSSKALSYRTGILQNVTTTLVAPYVVSGAVDPSGVDWATTMGFMAPPGEPIEFRVIYTDSNGASIEKTVPVQASALTGQVIEFTNVIEQLFGITGPSEGSIRVTGASRGQVRARLIAGGVPAGSFDLVPTASELTSGAQNRKPLYVEGLEQSTDPNRGSRWNLYIKEIGGEAGSVEVRLYEAGNRTHPIAVKELSIAASQQLALETVFDAMDLNTPTRRKDRTNVLCVVTPRSGGALVTAVAMEIDSATGSATSHLLGPASGLEGGVTTSLVRTIEPGSSTRRRPVRPRGTD